MVGKVCRDVLKWVQWLFRGDRRHRWLGGGIAVAGGASVPGCGDVLCDSRPEEGCLGPCGHAADALVGGVEGVEACGA